MEKLFKIGEVAKFADTTIKTIRYYEKVDLIKPVKVDEFSGYRYFDANAVQIAQKIQKLKKFGLSLSEIRAFILLDRDKQFDFINTKFKELEFAKSNLLALASHTARKIDFFFQNDSKAIGKWKCIAVAKDKASYFKGEVKEIKPKLPFLYFLKNGAGYELINGWTKGEIYHGHTLKYEIDKRLLFVRFNEFDVYVYEKVDSIERIEAEQDFFDDLNLDFVMDSKVLGLWKIYDHVFYKNSEEYNPCGGSGERYFIKSLAFFDDYVCKIDEDSYRRLRWTKNFLIDKKNKVVMKYTVKEVNDKKYLILEWKNDEYRYFGTQTWCYVFEKVE